MTNKDGLGDEFKYFDEHPEEDPFKENCSLCKGLGLIREPICREPFTNYIKCLACKGTGLKQ